MSASEASQEDRQLPASERRLQQAREDGQLPRSRDLVHLASIGALLGMLMSVGPWMGRQALELMSAGLRLDHDAVFQTGRMGTRLAEFGGHGLEALLPVAGGMAVLLGGATLGVGGWNFTLKALTPNYGRLNPLSGLSNLIGWKQLLGHGRLVALASGLLGAAWLYVSDHAGDLDALSRMPLHTAIVTGFGWIAAGLTTLAGVVAVAAVADVPLQIFQHRSKLKMTLEELKQENKESEGDPHVKGIRRQKQREMARGRMLANVPKASVVVTNPTHYAVALQYDEHGTGAPRIVAMGKDLLALKIREVAAAAQVPTLEAPPLARALYRHGELDREIPVALYTAVAQVLAWVFRLRGALRAPALPVIEVPAGMDPGEGKA